MKCHKNQEAGDDNQKKKYSEELLLGVMFFDILTLVPDMVEGFVRKSVLGKALEKGLFQFNCHNLRDWAEGRHQVTDDTPYGGGDGMVMKVEPVARALTDLKKSRTGSRVLLRRI